MDRTLRGFPGDAIDFVTKMVGIVNSDHAYIHRGIAFRSYILLDSIPVGGLTYLFHTPEDKYCHMKNILVSGVGGSYRFDIVRGTDANPITVTDQGSPTLTGFIGPNNLNDNAEQQVSSMTITDGPTLSAEGEVWKTIKSVGFSQGAAASLSTESTFSNEELVMKPDTDYLIKVYQVGDDAPTDIYLSMLWYEEGDG